MRKQTNPFDKMGEWCTHDVDADETKVKMDHSGDSSEMKCYIRSGNKHTKISLDEDANAKIELDNTTQHGKGQNWEGRVSEMDLHEDGVTMVTDESTYSLNWKNG